MRLYIVAPHKKKTTPANHPLLRRVRDARGGGGERGWSLCSIVKAIAGTPARAREWLSPSRRRTLQRCGRSSASPATGKYARVGPAPRPARTPRRPAPHRRAPCSVLRTMRCGGPCQRARGTPGLCPGHFAEHCLAGLCRARQRGGGGGRSRGSSPALFLALQPLPRLAQKPRRQAGPRRDVWRAAGGRLRHRRLHRPAWRSAGRSCHRRRRRHTLVSSAARAPGAAGRD